MSGIERNGSAGEAASAIATSLAAGKGGIVYAPAGRDNRDLLHRGFAGVRGRILVLDDPSHGVAAGAGAPAGMKSRLVVRGWHEVARNGVAGDFDAVFVRDATLAAAEQIGSAIGKVRAANPAAPIVGVSVVPSRRDQLDFASQFYRGAGSPEIARISFGESLRAGEVAETRTVRAEESRLRSGEGQGRFEFGGGEAGFDNLQRVTRALDTHAPRSGAALVVTSNPDDAVTLAGHLAARYPDRRVRFAVHEDTHAAARVGMSAETKERAISDYDSGRADILVASAALLDQRPPLARTAVTVLARADMDANLLLKTLRHGSAPHPDKSANVLVDLGASVERFRRDAAQDPVHYAPIHNPPSPSSERIGEAGQAAPYFSEIARQLSEDPVALHEGMLAKSPTDRDFVALAPGIDAMDSQIARIAERRYRVPVADGRMVDPADLLVDEDAGETAELAAARKMLQMSPERLVETYRRGAELERTEPGGQLDYELGMDILTEVAAARGVALPDLGRPTAEARYQKAVDWSRQTLRDVRDGKRPDTSFPARAQRVGAEKAGSVASLPEDVRVAYDMMKKHERRGGKDDIQDGVPLAQIVRAAMAEEGMTPGARRETRSAQARRASKEAWEKAFFGAPGEASVASAITADMARTRAVWMEVGVVAEHLEARHAAAGDGPARDAIEHTRADMVSLKRDMQRGLQRAGLMADGRGRVTAKGAVRFDPAVNVVGAFDDPRELVVRGDVDVRPDGKGGTKASVFDGAGWRALALGPRAQAGDPVDVASGFVTKGSSGRGIRMKPEGEVCVPDKDVLAGSDKRPVVAARLGQGVFRSVPASGNPSRDAQRTRTFLAACTGADADRESSQVKAVNAFLARAAESRVAADDPRIAGVVKDFARMVAADRRRGELEAQMAGADGRGRAEGVRAAAPRE